MMKKPRFLTLAPYLVLLVATGTSLLAHHSFEATFDGSKTLTLTGIVTRFDWINPHSFLYIDVKDDSGNTVKWAMQGSAPSGLTSRGWKKDTLKAGDSITACGYLPRTGSRVSSEMAATAPFSGLFAADTFALMHAEQITLPDGKKLIFTNYGITRCQDAK